MCHTKGEEAGLVTLLLLSQGLQEGYRGHEFVLVFFRHEAAISVGAPHEETGGAALCDTP